ncbi:MAG: winged helix-turn-helix domain-containing tetratricopeptide repeat protein [Pyrinomonadaceae bacterium]
MNNLIVPTTYFRPVAQVASGAAQNLSKFLNAMTAERRLIGYEFGPFRLLPSERLLLKDGKPVAVTPKVFDTLLVFVQHHGRLLSKDELIKLIWHGGIVEEGNLTQNIFVLRKVMGESPNDHRYLVTVPMQGYRFVAKVREVYDESAQDPPQRTGAGGSAHVPLTLAVLPFTLLNPPSGEHFGGLGIADTLITNLTKLKQLAVRPTNAILRYVDAPRDLPVVGRELGVEAVLDGTIQHLGERVRVNVQLIRVDGDSTIWADHFDETFTDAFAVQDAISERITQALRLELGGPTTGQTVPQYGQDLEAYQLYVKGRYFWNMRTEKGLLTAIEYAQQIVAAYPDNALGYVGLADSYLMLGEYLYRAPAEVFPQAKAYALKACELDENFARPWASLAEVALYHEWDWDAAERNYKRAIDADPNYATALHWYGWFLMLRARFDESVAYFKHAQTLDASSLLHSTDLGLPFYFGRQYDRAVAQFRHILELNPDFSPAQYYLGAALTHAGRHDEAITELTQTPLVEHKQQTTALIAFNYAVSGRKERAHELLRELQAAAERHYISPYLEALVYAGLGEREHAFARLDAAYKGRDPWLLHVKVDPFLDSLRADPRFREVLRRVGLAP